MLSNNILIVLRVLVFYTNFAPEIGCKVACIAFPGPPKSDAKLRALRFLGTRNNESYAKSQTRHD